MPDQSEERRTPLATNQYGHQSEMLDLDVEKIREISVVARKQAHPHLRQTPETNTGIHGQWVKRAPGTVVRLKKSPGGWPGSVQLVKIIERG